MKIGDRVMFVDMDGFGYREPYFPPGFMLVHGSKGEVIRIEHGYGMAIGTKKVQVPDRPQIAWDVRQYYDHIRDNGYQVSDKVYTSHGPVTWAHRSHVIQTQNREEVKFVEEIRTRVEEILHQWTWGFVLKAFPIGPERQWLEKQYPDPGSEKGMPEGMSAVTRKIVAYNYISKAYDNRGNFALAEQYERRRDAAILELHQIAADNELKIPRQLSTTKPNNKTTGGGAPMARAGETAKDKKEKQGKKAAVAVPVKPGKGGKWAGAAVTEALRATDGSAAAVVKVAKATFGVALEAARIADAPNPGILKMRAGNIIRGALKKEGRLA